MAQPKPSSIRVGPDPRDQQEEREARIAEMLARIQRHRDQAAYHLEQAEQHEREADRLRADGEASDVERRKKPRP
jgi:hypothetical protein